MTTTWPPFDDSPLDDLNGDALDQESIVRQVVRAVREISEQEESAVLAVVGRWGSGKTSVVNAALRRLPESIHITQFNPWAFASQAAAMAGFMRSIQTLFSESSKADTRATIGRFLTQHSALGGLGGFFGADLEGAVSELGKWMAGDLDMYDHRQKVVQLLRETKRHILVVVDDVDRLEPDELLTTFRLIRQLGRLPYIHYVICFDEVTLLDIIMRTGLAGNDSGRAREYLEKMVQARVDIAPPSSRRLISAVSQMLESFAQQHSIAWDWGERERLLRAWAGGVEVYLDRPRNLKRLLTQLVVIWPELAGRVDYVDLLLSLVLHMFEPRVIELFRRKPQLIRALQSNSAHVLVRDREALRGSTNSSERLPDDPDDLQPGDSEPRTADELSLGREGLAGVARDLEATERILSVLLNDDEVPQRKFGFPDSAFYERYLTLRASAVDDVNPAVRQAIDLLARGGTEDLDSVDLLLTDPPLQVLQSVKAFDAIEPLSDEAVIVFTEIMLARTLGAKSMQDEVQITLSELQSFFVEHLAVWPTDRALALLEEATQDRSSILFYGPLLVYDGLPKQLRDAWWSRIISGADSLLNSSAFTSTDYGNGETQKVILRELANRLDEEQFTPYISRMVMRLSRDDPHVALRLSFWAREASSALSFYALAASTAPIADAIRTALATGEASEELRQIMSWPDGRTAIVFVAESCGLSLDMLLPSCSAPLDDFEDRIVNDTIRIIEESLVQNGDERWLIAVSRLCLVIPIEDLQGILWSIVNEHDFLNPYDLANQLYADGPGLDEVEMSFGLSGLTNWLAARPEDLARARGRGRTKAGNHSLIHILDEHYGLRNVQDR